MLRRGAFSTVLLLGLLSVLLVAGCGGEDESHSTWTIQEGALTLERNLLAGDDEPYFFASINDVAVGTDGSIYVADGNSSHIKVLAPDGTLQDTVGRSGLGPGEFRRPSEVHVARGDSLYVLDGDFRGLLSVFGPDYEFVRRTSLGSKYLEDRPAEVVHISKNGYLVAFNSIPHPEEGKGRSKIRRVSFQGVPKDTLLTYPPSTQPMEKTDQGLRFYRIPYTRGDRVEGDAEGNVYYTWSDSLGVRTYGPEGELRHTIDIPFEPIPVTERDLEQKLSDWSEEEIAEVKKKNMLPATKPAFEHFLVDDEGRYWFGRPTANPDSTEWWVAWPEEQRVATTTLPSEVRLTVVRNGRAYGRTTTENGAPALVRYRIRVAQ